LPRGCPAKKRKLTCENARDRNSPGISQERCFSLAGAAFVFFGIVFFSALFSLQGNGRLSATWMWLAIGITAFAFIAYAFTDPEYLSKLEVHTVDGRPAYSIIGFPAAGA
jgi:hypothetical protein